MCIIIIASRDIKPSSVSRVSDLKVFNSGLFAEVCIHLLSGVHFNLFIYILFMITITGSVQTI